MALQAGVQLGPYEVVAPLGAGGMGEVYRARDARLRRDVAVKVLPASFAQDADRLRRFEQEAQATSALNHPNILSIFDFGSYQGAPYVVSELLEGQTLREKISGGALPLRKTIEVAAQVARGLAAAHEKGVVHRDLKPDNLFVTRDGRVKILDFGLAKLVGSDLVTEGETASMGAPATEAGKVVGTVGYMSPEQVRAQPVDHRSDIFSFGAVLYEMLSGKRAFRGESAVETMNAILKEDPPPLAETDRHLPPALERIVSHCLEKNPEERFQSARDIAFDIEALSGQSSQTLAAAPALPRRWRRPVVLGIVGLAIAGASFVAGQHQPAGRRATFQALTFRRGSVDGARFAPDGRTVIYAARWEGNPSEIFSTQAGSPESRSLELKDAALAAVSSIGELAIIKRAPTGFGGTLARMPVGGGAPRDVLEGVDGADWSPDGASLAVVRVSGARTQIEFPIGKVLYESGAGISSLRVSPRGDAIAFTEHPVLGDNRGNVCVVDLAGKKKTLAAGFEDVGGLAWWPDGREVWFTGARAGPERQLYAVSPSGRLTEKEAVPGNLVLQDISRDGKLILSHGTRRPVIECLAPGQAKEVDLSWLDWPYVGDLSPDGKQLLFSEQGIAGGPGYAVYLRGTDGSPAVRLGKGLPTALSPDGKWALAISLGGPVQLTLLPTGAGEARSLPRGSLAAFHWASFFPDGRRVVITANEEGRGPRLFVQDLAGGDPKPFTAEGVFTRFNTVTPDGRFAAAVESSGPPRLYPLGGGEPQPIKGAVAGDEPLRFGADGRTLYVAGAGRPGTKVFRLDIVSGRRELWKEFVPADLAGVGGITNAAITPDGKSYAYTFLRVLSSLYLVDGLR